MFLHLRKKRIQFLTIYHSILFRLITFHTISPIVNKFTLDYLLGDFLDIFPKLNIICFSAVFVCHLGKYLDRLWNTLTKTNKTVLTLMHAYNVKSRQYPHF